MNVLYQVDLEGETSPIVHFSFMYT